MCAGAIYWAGIGRVVFGQTGPLPHLLAATPPRFYAAGRGSHPLMTAMPSIARCGA
jgi:tRNA(Arg) A34 adenosine deaminase TadA